MGRDLTDLALSRDDRVVAISRRQDALSSLQSTYPPNQFLPLTFQATTPADIRAAFVNAKEVFFGRVDVGMFGEVEDTPEDAARTLFGTNFWGPANVTGEAVRFFREENLTGEEGRLISVSSYVGSAPLGGAGYHSASKAGECVISS